MLLLNGADSIKSGRFNALHRFANWVASHGKHNLSITARQDVAIGSDVVFRTLSLWTSR